MIHEAAAQRRKLRFDLLDLELFALVVETGSITRGAERAHLSLPSASARIRTMESTIGAPLFVRGRRGVTATPAGHLLHRHARTVLHDIEQMSGDLATYSEGVVATVKILANTSAVASTLPADLVPFLLSRPNIDVDLEEQQSFAIVQAVADGRAEIGIVANTVDLGTLKSEDLREDNLVLAVAPKHPFASCESMHFRDALGEAFVGLSERSALQEHLEGQAMPLGMKPAYRVRLPTAEGVCGAVWSGVGVCVLPEAVVRRYQHQYPVVTVPLEDAWAKRQLVLCADLGRPLSAPAQALAEHLITVMAGNDEPSWTGRSNRHGF